MKRTLIAVAALSAFFLSSTFAGSNESITINGMTIHDYSPQFCIVVRAMKRRVELDLNYIPSEWEKEFGKSCE